MRTGQIKELGYCTSEEHFRLSTDGRTLIVFGNPIAGTRIEAFDIPTGSCLHRYRAPLFELLPETLYEANQDPNPVVQFEQPDGS